MMILVEPQRRYFFDMLQRMMTLSQFECKIRSVVKNNLSPEERGETEARHV
jgi:hypothetical protein